MDHPDLLLTSLRWKAPLEFKLRRVLWRQLRFGAVIPPALNIVVVGWPVGSGDFRKRCLTDFSNERSDVRLTCLTTTPSELNRESGNQAHIRDGYAINKLLA
jgi:hypothetical protein